MSLIFRTSVHSLKCFFRFQHTDNAKIPYISVTAENYPGHILLSPLQKCVLTIGSGIGCLLNPKRADLLSAFGETSGEYALRRIYSQMLNHPDASGQLSAQIQLT
ncbi:unnamed protein product [Heterobilharzia americana]|nr:unnamed protein product [Heterobilharzia americana]